MCATEAVIEALQGCEHSCSLSGASLFGGAGIDVAPGGTEGCARLDHARRDSRNVAHEASASSTEPSSTRCKGILSTGSSQH